MLCFPPPASERIINQPTTDKHPEESLVSGGGERRRKCEVLKCWAKALAASRPARGGGGGRQARAVISQGTAAPTTTESSDSKVPSSARSLSHAHHAHATGQQRLRPESSSVPSSLLGEKENDNCRFAPVPPLSSLARSTTSLARGLLRS